MTEAVTLRLGKEFPNLDVKTTQGDFKLHEWKGKSWMLFFSHPRDFTPVCTTELSAIASRASEFEKRGVKLIGLSCDDVASHNAWKGDVLTFTEKKCGTKLKDLPYPLIDDSSRAVAKALGMIDADESNTVGMPLTCRAVFIVGPDNLLKLFLYYPATTGRNVDELLRVIDSLQLTATASVATPVDWCPGKKVMITPSTSDENAKKIDPKFEIVNVPSKKQYLRMANMSK